jgi:hypothetical protein
MQDAPVLIGAVNHGHRAVLAEKGQQLTDQLSVQLVAEQLTPWPAALDQGAVEQNHGQIIRIPAGFFQQASRRQGVAPGAKCQQVTRFADTLQGPDDPAVQHVVEFGVQQGAIHIDGHQQSLLSIHWYLLIHGLVFARTHSGPGFFRVNQGKPGTVRKDAWRG